MSLTSERPSFLQEIRALDSRLRTLRQSVTTLLQVVRVANAIWRLTDASTITVESPEGTIQISIGRQGDGSYKIVAPAAIIPALVGPVTVTGNLVVTGTVTATGGYL